MKTYYCLTVDTSVAEKYGNRLRIRVCGLCWQENRLLMVNHHGLYGHDFWAPPGGGLEWGQSVEATLVREFKEETDVSVTVGNLKFVCEFILSPLHAIELFFDVSTPVGVVTTGTDPELHAQIIKEVRFLEESEVLKLPHNHLHGVFKGLKRLEDIRQLGGYYRI